VLDAKVTGDLDAWARAASRAAIEATRELVGGITSEVYNAAKSAWPVRPKEMVADHPRGYSRSRLGDSVRLEGDGTTVGRIANDANYAYMIKSRRVEVPAGSQYEAAWGRKMLSLLEQQQRIQASGGIYTRSQSGKSALTTKRYRANQRKIRQHAARARDAKHVWTLLVREPMERKSANLREQLAAAVVKAVEGVG
jgi:hypothetical protein